MNLVANTQSFTHPLNDNELRKYKNCVFQKSKDFDGELWSGQAVKPITIKTVKDGEYDLNKLFILKKKSKKLKIMSHTGHIILINIPTANFLYFSKL